MAPDLRLAIETPANQGEDKNEKYGFEETKARVKIQGFSEALSAWLSGI